MIGASKLIPLKLTHVRSYRVIFEHVTAKVETESIEGYRFTTACGQHVSEGKSDRDALDEVHERLQGFFADIISDDAKTDWGLERSDA